MDKSFGTMPPPVSRSSMSKPELTGAPMPPPPKPGSMKKDRFKGLFK
jgi:hypothetical protein